MGFFFGDQAQATKQAALEQQRQYEQKVTEQQNAAILQGQNVAESIATINVGGGDTYIDDPFRKKKTSKSSSTQLGIY